MHRTERFSLFIIFILFLFTVFTTGCSQSLTTEGSSTEIPTNATQ